MNFISVCSGIEAASVAFAELGWEAIAFSEIEPFPCAVLKHHYPDIPNYGDMTRFMDWPEEVFVNADAIVGGPPCQSFSVAGRRGGLGDKRGNLTLIYTRLIDHADGIRAKHGKPPVVVLYENVPGILSDKTNAFGCFLSAIAGEDEAFIVKKWPRAGVVDGRRRRVAWCVLDAQWFGLAQRRRRIFVVAIGSELVESAGDRADPAEILSIGTSLRRDSAPSRDAGQVAPTIPSRSTAGGGLGTDIDCDGGLIQAFGGNRTSGPIEVSPALLAQPGSGWKGDFESETFITQTAHSLRGEGFDASEDGTGRGTPLVPVAFHPTQDPISSTDGTTHALGCGSSGGQASVAVATYAIQAGALRTNPASGPDGVGVQADRAYTLEARAEVQAVAVALRGREGGATAELGDEVQNCLRASSGGGDKPHVLVPVVDTLYNKGIVTLKEGNASTQETYPGTLLRALRQEVGAEAFAKWGLGILDSLQQAEVLRQALHGLSIRPASFSRSWVVHCSLSRQEDGSGWLLQSLRETGCEGCPPQGWEPPEQLAGELRAYLSELSQPGAQASRFMRDLWWASQGAGLLREALSAVQEMGRSAIYQGKPIHSSKEGTGATGAQGLQGAGLHGEVPREGVLQQTRAAREAWHVGGSSTEQIGGRTGSMAQAMMVRRLTCEEAEFLQGFPRGYTAIPWRKKPASECPDGPRYKALGNSWAVPVVRWIGCRIDAAMRRAT